MRDSTKNSGNGNNEKIRDRYRFLVGSDPVISNSGSRPTLNIYTGRMIRSVGLLTRENSTVLMMPIVLVIETPAHWFVAMPHRGPWRKDLLCSSASREDRPDAPRRSAAA
jgi:hypothetical protein